MVTVPIDAGRARRHVVHPQCRRRGPRRRPRPRRRSAAGRRGGAHRRGVPGRESARSCCRPRPRSTGGPTRSSWAPTSSAGPARRSSSGPGRRPSSAGSPSELGTAPRPTGFERGITQFGYLLVRATLVLVVAIFVVNLVLHRPLLESLLFSLALAVGLTPQLLPAIVAREPLDRRPADGARAGDRQAPRRHRGLRRHDRALHRQDRHDHRRERSRWPARWTSHGAPSEQVRRLAWLNAALPDRLRQPARRTPSSRAATSTRSARAARRGALRLQPQAAERARRRRRRTGCWSPKGRSTACWRSAPTRRPSAAPSCRSDGPCDAIEARFAGSAPRATACSAVATRATAGRDRLHCRRRAEMTCVGLPGVRRPAQSRAPARRSANWPGWASRCG